MKKQALTLLFLLVGFGQAASAESMNRLKLRVNGYVAALMEGKRSPLLAPKDYYSPIYVTSKATVEKIEPLSGGRYLATLRFETTGQILQAFETGIIEKTEKVQKESFVFKLVFSVSAHSLRWKTKLEAPFVKRGKETTYLLSLSPEKPGIGDKSKAEGPSKHGKKDKPHKKVAP